MPFDSLLCFTLSINQLQSFALSIFFLEWFSLHSQHHDETFLSGEILSA